MRGLRPRWYPRGRAGRAGWWRGLRGWGAGQGAPAASPSISRGSRRRERALPGRGFVALGWAGLAPGLGDWAGLAPGLGAAAPPGPSGSRCPERGAPRVPLKGAAAPTLLLGPAGNFASRFSAPSLPAVLAVHPRCSRLYKAEDEHGQSAARAGCGGRDAPGSGPVLSHRAGAAFGMSKLLLRSCPATVPSMFAMQGCCSITVSSRR